MRISTDNFIVRIFILILGFLIIYHGISTIIKARFYWFGLFIVVENNKYFIGCLFILLGLFFVWLSIWRKAIRVIEGEFFKCTRCGEVIDSKSLKNLICPKCDGVLEELEGFFERHPEIKN